MATWTNFYIHTDKTKSVTEKLSELTDNLTIIADSEFPPDIGEYQQLDTDLAPNYIAVGNTQPDWTTVVHNSFDKLEDWAELLSSHFDSKVIVTIAQSVSSSYYFALYDKGQKLREIETCYSTDFEEINYGQKFSFENETIGRKVEWDEEESYIFTFDEIEEYCGHFGLIIQTNFNQVKWTVLKGQNLRKEVFEHVQKLITKKPWWKFW